MEGRDAWILQIARRAGVVTKAGADPLRLDEGVAAARIPRGISGLFRIEPRRKANHARWQGAAGIASALLNLRARLDGANGTIVLPDSPFGAASADRP